jgi:adenine-specific DNA-methyltransferase
LTPLIESFSNPGDVVLDPFCGSGSTLVAAQQQRRRFVGIELSKRYFDLEEQRLR